MQNGSHARASLRPLAPAILLALGLVLPGGCNDNQFGAERRHPNRPPETVLSSGPPDSTYDTNYRVHLYWSGSDADGVIDHFDFILVDHPAIDDSIATSSPDAGNRVVVEVPAPDDTRWTGIGVTDTILVTVADTLRLDASPPRGSDLGTIDRHNEFIRRQSFERWHTFFIRAVDNEGTVDETPDYRSFNATNLAPRAFLLPPVSPSTSEFRGPPTMILNWDGADPLGDRNEIAPVASRWAIVTTTKNALGYRGLPDTLYRLPPSAWSPWRAWDARDGSGRSAIVRNLRPAGEPGAGFYLFAVQAMDEAGAVTPVFDWKTPGKNNVTPLFVTGDVGPTTTVREPFLGTYVFASTSRPLNIDVAAGQPVHFCWRADATAYGGRIEGYRFGWDLRNPDDDAEWQQGWSQTALCAPTRVFQSGTHTFFLQTRDNAETISQIRIDLIVRQVSRGRDLLVIDDSSQPQGDTDPNEAREDRRWLAIVDSLRQVQPFVFDPTRDVYDVRQIHFPPPLSLVFDYKTVVWLVVSSTNGSAIHEIAYFTDPFAPNATAQGGFNFLNVYLDNGGELWLCGQQPTFALWPLTDRPTPQVLPANLTNWNLDLHPLEDSVATTGLLYRMGIEAVDMGSGGIVQQPRSDRLDQGCIGLRRAGGPGGGAREFVSNQVLDHTHTLVIPGPDVDLPPADGASYVTSTDAGHSHVVRLSTVQLDALRSGGMVSIESEPADAPSPHSHRFELVDEIGTWGAPAFLSGDASWSQPPFAVNPYGSRVNVEIYNMPTFCALQTPPLSPPVDRVLPLYLFASPTAADPDRRILYPQTADGQPAFILAKRNSLSTAFSRAYCGFEPWRLTFQSHLALAKFVLLRHMRLGLPDDP